MSNSNGKITAPVQINDVRNVLGSNSKDLGTLCRMPNINIWAKYKPVYGGAIDTVTNQWDATNNTWLSTATWFKGRKRVVLGGGGAVDSYGIITKWATDDVSEFKNLVDTGNVGWTHDKPEGTTSSPFRLQDFAGYNHNGIVRFVTWDFPAEVKPSGQVSASISINFNEHPDYINVNDVGNLGNYYWGVVVYSGNTYVGEVNSQIKLSGTATATESPTNIAFKMPAATGEYTVYPCLFKNPKTSTALDNQKPATQTYVPLPLKLDKKTINVTENTSKSTWVVVASATVLYKSTISQGKVRFTIWLCTGEEIKSVSAAVIADTIIGSIKQPASKNLGIKTAGSDTTTTLKIADEIPWSLFGETTAERNQNFYNFVEQATRGNAYLDVSWSIYGSKKVNVILDPDSDNLG